MMLHGITEKKNEKILVALNQNVFFRVWLRVHHLGWVSGEFFECRVFQDISDIDW